MLVPASRDACISAFIFSISATDSGEASNSSHFSSHSISSIRSKMCSANMSWSLRESFCAASYAALSCSVAIDATSFLDLIHLLSHYHSITASLTWVEPPSTMPILLTNHVVPQEHDQVSLHQHIPVHCQEVDHEPMT